MATITITNGYFDGNVYYPTSSVNWSALGSSPYGTWSNWTTWSQSPSSMTVKVFEDAEINDYRLPTLGLRWEGELTVTLKISDTVDSNLNLISPTILNMVEGIEYSPVSGRYYEYTLVLTTDSNTSIPSMTAPMLDFDTAKISQFQETVNTATLSGTIDARVVDTTVGTVTAIVATATEQGVTYSNGTLRDRVYAIPDDYVFQENAIIVNIVDKATPSIRCFDLNGESIDAVVDIWIQGLPSLQLTALGVQRT